MANNDISGLILITTAIFMIALVAVLAYILLYNHRKRKHIEEKAQMKVAFEAEIIKAQLEVQEQTMQTIGADLHDNIGQLLSLTSLTLNSVELENKAKAKEKINAAIDLTVRSIKEMRLLGKLLQGDQLIVLGLPEAIRHEISWMEKSGKYKIIYTENEQIPNVGSPDKDLIIFRILQEILNNIIKHACASNIIVNLQYADGILQLLVSDDGIGFNAGALAADSKGMGLQNIYKRAQIIEGEVLLKSNPGEGTQISIFTPYP